MKLPPEYYQHGDVLFLSRDLIGKFLFTSFQDIVTGGMIIETEAYRGPEDKASHAYAGRRTPRNEAMYLPGGRCYVFRCYGIHNLFNIVTNAAEIPHAILIRAIKPFYGIPEMLKRRGKQKLEPSLSAGPGTLTEALGITLEHNAFSLAGPEIWIEDRGFTVATNEIIIGPRVGIDYAGEDALLPWRFRFKPQGI
jgi:DNA-3-methyladenine glycosylase